MMPRAQSRSIDDREDWNGSKFGAALTPMRARPRSQPQPPSPEVGADHSYNVLGPFGVRRAIAITNSCELLPLGHMPCGASFGVRLGQKQTWRCAPKDNDRPARFVWLLALILNPLRLGPL